MSFGSDLARRLAVPDVAGVHGVAGKSMKVFFTALPPGTLVTLPSLDSVDGESCQGCKGTGFGASKASCASCSCRPPKESPETLPHALPELLTEALLNASLRKAQKVSPEPTDSAINGCTSIMPKEVPPGAYCWMVLAISWPAVLAISWP